MSLYKIIPISVPGKANQPLRGKNYAGKSLATSCYHPFSMKKKGRGVSILGQSTDPIGPVEYNSGKLFGLMDGQRETATYEEIGNYHQYVSTENLQKSFGRQGEDGAFESDPYLFTLYFNKR